MYRIKIHLLLALLCLMAAGLRAANRPDIVKWDAQADQVSVDVHGEPLWPLLEDIAHQTGWHIFVEPDTARNVDVKFENLTGGEALHKLLGDLNFAFVPKTNEASQLYVFKTSMQNATRRVQGTNTVAKAGPQRHVPNQLLIKLKPGVDVDALAKSIGAKVVGRDDKLRMYLLEFPDAAATDAALASLKSNSDVQSVDYNYIYDPPPTPQLYSGNLPAQPRLIADVSNPGDPCNPIVALIDTAYQPSGSSLDQFAMKPISVTGSDCPPSTTMTHATAMYQTILTGVSQASGGHTAAKILPINVFGCDGTTIDWWLIQGLQAAGANGATVINMSLGGTTDSPMLEDVVNQLLAQGVVMYAAAGNQPVATQTFPAAIPGVNAVTALSAPGQLASYANYGNFVSMALPGASIVSFGGQSYVVQGTSPATAYATGVAVGTKGINCLPWSQIESAMQQKFPVPQGQQ